MSPTRQPDWTTIRQDYPGVAGRTYFDTACKGVPSSAAVSAVVEHAHALQQAAGASATEDTLKMLDQFDRARSAAAKLINAMPQDIALMPSTEAGLASIASALRLQPGSNIVSSDLDFAGTVLAFRGFEERGVELRLSSHRAGRLDLADLDAAIDNRTRAVVISSVQEVNGFAVDLKSLLAICRARKAALIVDAIQHLGPLKLDVAELDVDALAVGGHKWIGAPFGMGFLYVSPRFASELEPPVRSLMTAQAPPQGWTRYLEDPQRHPRDIVRFLQDARKLEQGALGTTMAAAGLAAALETLLAIGPDAIALRSQKLVQSLRTTLDAVGANVITPIDSAPSSILTFRTSEDLDDEREVATRLTDSGILTSLRFTTGVGGIRVSPYFYNDDSDVERLGAAVASALASRARRRITGRPLPALDTQ